MKKEIYDNLALMVEYEFTLGGSQRMLSTIAKRMEKPVYVLSSNKNPRPVWDIKPKNDFSKEKIVFSPVVDRYKFQKLKGKNQIKFAHSGTSLENFVDNIDAKKTPWLTHRKRAYEYWNDKGFNIHLIPRGYIPFDKKELQINQFKENTSAFISRICPEKLPEMAAEISNSTDIPLYIAGSWEFRDYVEKIKEKNESENVRFVKPDRGIGVSLDLQDNILKKSKVLIHGSNGFFHDYLEYSILDGLVYGCVPLCITPDKKQFSVIEDKNMGRVVKNKGEAKEALKDLISNYDFYLENSKNYMKNFLNNQESLWKRWESSIENIVLTQF